VPARCSFRGRGGGANKCGRGPARLHGRHAGRTEIVSCHNSFHGRTFGALSVTGNAAKREPFAPLPRPVTCVDYCDATAPRTAVGPQTAAVIVEPALGEGGVVPPPAGFLAAVRALCDAAGAPSDRARGAS